MEVYHIVKSYWYPINGAIGSIGMIGAMAGTTGAGRGGGGGKTGGGITMVGGMIT